MLHYYIKSFTRHWENGHRGGWADCLNQLINGYRFTDALVFINQGGHNSPPCKIDLWWRLKNNLLKPINKGGPKYLHFRGKPLKRPASVNVAEHS
jgi:hypothetical protein